MNYDALQAKVMNFLSDPVADSFEELALAVFGFQYAHNSGYRAYCDARNSGPDHVAQWQAIPALPCDAFKCQPSPFCGKTDSAVRCFLTSGTTGETRGHHYFQELVSYQASILAGWRECGLPSLAQCAFVSRPPGSHPDSSLMFMFETLASEGESARWLLDCEGTPHYPDFDESPLLLFGTALNLIDFLRRAPNGFALPATTWVFQTGGYKGRQKESSPNEIYDTLASAGVPRDRVINEYGMTELSSQAYAIGQGSAHRCPPWMRVRVIDPETGLPQPTGIAGYLEIVDLANLGSTLAVRTQDIAVAVTESEFLLQGRDASALPRGCSRSEAAALSLP